MMGKEADFEFMKALAEQGIVMVIANLKDVSALGFAQSHFSGEVIRSPLTPYLTLC